MDCESTGRLRERKRFGAHLHFFAIDAAPSVKDGVTVSTFTTRAHLSERALLFGKFEGFARLSFW